MTYFEQQKEFFLAAGCPTVELKGLDFCCTLAKRLIEEEVIIETLSALEKYRKSPSRENLAELADGLVDSVYVLLHAAHSFDIPFDLIWDEIHSSNLAKIGPNGRVERREDGKINKPKHWIPPNVFAILVEHQTRKQMGDDYMRTGMVK